MPRETRIIVYHFASQDGVDDLKKMPRRIEISIILMYWFKGIVHPQK